MKITSLGVPNSQGSLRQLNADYLKTVIGKLVDLIKTEIEFLEKNFEQLDNLYSQRDIPDQHQLVLYKYLMNFDCFLLVSKRIEPHFNTATNIMKRFCAMREIFERMAEEIKANLDTTTPTLFDEADCFRQFQSYFSKELFSEIYFRKCCSEIWHRVRDGNSKDSLEVSIQVIYENIKLFLFGISLPTTNAADYPLHRAIYESNLAMIPYFVHGNPNLSLLCKCTASGPSRSDSTHARCKTKARRYRPHVG